MGFGKFLLQVIGAGFIGFLVTKAFADPIGSLKNGSVFVCNELQGVWVLIDGEKREIPNESIFDQLGLKLRQVVTVSCDLVDSISDGPPLSENDKGII